MAKFGEWISVEKETPEPGVLSICACYGSDLIIMQEGESLWDAIDRQSKIPHIDVGYINDDGFWDTYDAMPMIVKPRYWMPMPEPPVIERDSEDAEK